MTPEGQRPAQCPDRGQPHSDMGVQPLENKTLSWGIIRKSACILAEITIRKSPHSPGFRGRRNASKGEDRSRLDFPLIHDVGVVIPTAK